MQISCAVTATADQRLCFCYIDSTILLNVKLLPYSPVCVGPGWKPSKTDFLVTQLILLQIRVGRATHDSVQTDNDALLLLAICLSCNYYVKCCFSIIFLLLIAHSWQLIIIPNFF